MESDFLILNKSIPGLMGLLGYSQRRFGQKTFSAKLSQANQF
jgi:hypothetical protein